MQVHNQAFTLFGQPIYWYGIIIALGVCAAAVCGWVREKRLSLPKDTLLDLALIVLPLGVLCARLYYVAFDWDQFSGDFLAIVNIRRGGLAIYGGIIGGALGVALYARHKRIPFLQLADLLVPAVLLAQGIGRWGNFVNQEAYGTPVTSAAMQWFPLAVFIQADQTWHYATFFYESVWCILAAMALLLLERRGGIKRIGDGFWLYVLMYMAERTVVEGLRTDSLMLMGIRISQWLSIAGVAFVGLLFARRVAGLGRFGARLHIVFCVLLLVAMVACAALDTAAWAQLLLFSALALAHGLFMYAQLPSANPYQ